MLTCLFFSSNVYSQDPSLSCVSGCTSNDVRIQSAYLVDPTTLQPLANTVPCTFGQTVNVKLALELITKTPRVGVYIFANLRHNTTNAIIGDVSECFSTALGTTGPTTKVVFTEQISWNCGTPIKLTDVYIGWGTGNTDFCQGSSAPRCPATPSKCYSLPPGEYIPVVTFPCTPAGVTADPSNTTKCISDNATFSVTFTAGSNTQVTELKWQVDKNDGAGFVDFPNSTSPYSVSALTLPATSGTSTLTINPLSSGLNGYKYRAFLGSTSSSGQSCSNTSNSGTLTVTPASVGGSVGSPQTICTGTQPNSDLTLSGNTGSVLRWEKSVDAAFTSPITIANTTTTLSAAAIGNLSVDTWFRAVVKNGDCASANSGSVKITITSASAGGTVASAQTICYNSQPANISVSGQNGTIVRWEKSVDAAFTTPITIANTSATLTSAQMGNLTADTWFRVVVQNSPCPIANSAGIKITVSAVPSAPTICLVQPSICGPATGSITVLSPLGAGYQYSKDGGTNWQTSPEFPNLAAGSNPSITYKTPGNCVSSAATCGSGSVCQSQSQRTNSVTETEATARSLGSATLEAASSVTVKAMPNPFSNQVRFMITNTEAGNGTLDIYNMAGQKVKTVYQGHIPAGTSYFDLNLATQARANLVYVLKIGEKKTTGNLVHLSTN